MARLFLRAPRKLRDRNECSGRGELARRPSRVRRATGDDGRRASFTVAGSETQSAAPGPDRAGAEFVARRRRRREDERRSVRRPWRPSECGASRRRSTAAAARPRRRGRRRASRARHDQRMGALRQPGRVQARVVATVDGFGAAACWATSTPSGGANEMGARCTASASESEARASSARRRALPPCAGRRASRHAQFRAATCARAAQARLDRRPPAGTTARRETRRARAVTSGREHARSSATIGRRA